MSLHPAGKYSSFSPRSPAPRVSAISSPGKASLPISTLSTGWRGRASSCWSSGAADDREVRGVFLAETIFPLLVPDIGRLSLLWPKRPGGAPFSVPVRWRRTVDPAFPVLSSLSRYVEEAVTARGHGRVISGAGRKRVAEGRRTPLPRELVEGNGSDHRAFACTLGSMMVHIHSASSRMFFVWI